MAIFRWQRGSWLVEPRAMRGLLIPAVEFILLIAFLLFSSRHLGPRRGPFMALVSIAVLAPLQWLLAGNDPGGVWKYTDLQFAAPLLVALVLASRTGLLVAALAALGVLTVSSFSSRSAAFALWASALLCLPATSLWIRTIPRSLRRALLFVGPPLALLAGWWLLLRMGDQGLLPAVISEAAAQQYASNGVFGDRVGIVLALAILPSFPLGLGIGSVLERAAAIDVLSAASSLGVSVDSPFVSNYILGAEFFGVPRLHSGWADLILWTGLVGLAVALALYLVVGSTVETCLLGKIHRDVRPLVYVAAPIAYWQLWGGGLFTFVLAVVIWAWADPALRIEPSDVERAPLPPHRVPQPAKEVSR